MSAHSLRDLDLRAVAKSTVREYFDDDMPTHAAALSYHIFFALFPFLLFLLALLSFVDMGGVFDDLLAEASRVLPPVALERIVEVIGEVRGQGHGGLLSFGIASAIWLASSGLRSTMGALNKAYDIAEQRPLAKRYAISIAYTVALAVLIAFATVLMVVGPALAGRIAGWIGMDELVLTLWSWLRVPVAMALVMISVSLIYQFAPNRRERLRIITPGSVLAVALWAAAALAFSTYVTRFARYSVTYGSVGAIIVLLLYIYLSSSVMLLGAELNAEVVQRRREKDARGASEG